MVRGVQHRRLILYGTSACHLCERAELLIRASLEDGTYFLHKVDIAEDQLLLDRYGLCIPVLEIEGVGESLSWPFDGDQVLQYIHITHIKKPEGSVA